jgi:hypothetical protein
MKLRIDENRIRLRLTGGEPERLLREGCMRGGVAIGPAPDLPFRYALMVEDTAAATLHHRDGELRVSIPLAWAADLASSARGEFTFEPTQENGVCIRVEIECDRPCAHKPAGQGESSRLEVIP